MAKAMEGPFVRIQLVDHAGNIIKKDGIEQEDEWEFNTLAEAFDAFETVTAAFDEEYGPEGADDDEHELEEQEDE